MFGKPSEEQSDDFKKKREVFAENMRKTNREEIFSKRRNILESEKSTQEKGTIEVESTRKDKILIVDQRFYSEIESYLKMTYSMMDFSKLLQSINDADILKQHYGLIGIRKILSIAENPPIQAIIDAGLVPRMIEYVKQTEYPQLQLEATWALTNVASGTTIQCQSIIDKGGIPLFVDLLKSDNLGIVEQAIWAIGNISSDCVFYRDAIIRAGGLSNLVMCVEKMVDQTLIKHGCWALSNLCRGTPLPKYDSVKSAIQLLCKLIASNKLADLQIVADCSWAISYHSDATKNKIQAVLQTGIVPKIIKNLTESPIGLVVPCIRVIGNISTGTSIQADQLLKYDVFTPLQKLLEHHKKVVRREACWVISNLAAGTREQVDALLNRETMMKRILQLFETDGNDVRRQICFIFSNMSHSGEPNRIFSMYKNCSIIRYYVNLLSSEDAKTIQISLECLFIVLALGDKCKVSQQEKNSLVMDLHSSGSVDLLQKLQYHKSDKVYENVSRILQTYFEIQDPLEI